MTTPVVTKKPQSPLASHLKKHNVFAWISAVCSVLMIVLLFLPWLSIPKETYTAEQTINKALNDKFGIEASKKLTKETKFDDIGVDPAELVEYLEKKDSYFFFNVPEEMQADFPNNVETIGELIKLYDVEHYPVSLVPDLLMNNLKNTDLLIFLIPLLVGVLVVHILYLVSLFRPGHDPFYAGTVAMLLVGVLIFVFVFAGDAAYSLVSKSTNPESFFSFLGIDKWTWVPATWFVIGFLQKLVFVRLAHKKKKSQ